MSGRFPNLAWRKARRFPQHSKGLAGMLTQQANDQLETYIDRYSAQQVLLSLVEIAEGKAEHVAVNWPRDRYLRQKWQRLAKILAQAADRSQGV